MAGHIVALGGGGFSTQPDDLRTDAFILSLARRPRPWVCFVPTAGGDSPTDVARFYRACAAHDCRPSDLGLFERTVSDLRGFVLEQDVVYVGGGNTASLLAVWRAHGLDAVLSEALDGGTVLCGVSAGMNCWFQASVTDSYDLAALAPLHDGLGFLPGSACPHYDGEPRRRPTYRALYARGFRPDTPPTTPPRCTSQTASCARCSPPARARPPTAWKPRASARCRRVSCPRSLSQTGPYVGIGRYPARGTLETGSKASLDARRAHRSRTCGRAHG